MEQETDTRPDDPAPETWLTLHAACALLGVAPSTLRRWADAGRIATRRTAGGHRRFDPEAVQALAPAPPAPAGPLRAVIPPAPVQQSWHVHLIHSPAAAQMRELGQRMLGLLIQYLAWTGDDARFLTDGRAVGARYGALAREAGVTLSETVQAFLYFRSTFWRMALQIPAVAQASDAEEMVRLTERIDQFMNGVLLSTIDAYEQAARAGDPR